jgi:hypothetical protein
LGSEAEHGLRGKFADVEAGVEGGGEIHLRPAHTEWLCQRMLWSL